MSPHATEQKKKKFVSCLDVHPQWTVVGGGAARHSNYRGGTPKYNEPQREGSELTLNPITFVERHHSELKGSFFVLLCTKTEAIRAKNLKPPAVNKLYRMTLELIRKSNIMKLLEVKVNH